MSIDLTDKVKKFTSALSTIDTFWKVLNIFGIFGCFVISTAFIPKRDEIPYFIGVAIGLFVLYKIVDLIRIFSLGVAWVLLSINKNVERELPSKKQLPKEKITFQRTIQNVLSKEKATKEQIKEIIRKARKHGYTEDIIKTNFTEDLFIAEW